MSGYAVKRDSGLFIGDVDNSPASGTIEITENGTNIDVARYAKANVNVPQPSGKINITQNGTDIDISEYALADVNVDTTDVAYKMMVVRDTSPGVGTRYSILPTNEYRVDDNVTQIGDYAFAALGLCETIDLSNINALYAVGDYAFFAGIRPNGAYMTSILQSVIFPKDGTGVASIGNHAFEGCTNLTTLDLRAFYDIGSNCFANSGITTLYFGANIKFEADAFRNANNLTDIYYEGTQSQWEESVDASISGLSSSVTIHYDYAPSN